MLRVDFRINNNSFVKKNINMLVCLQDIQLVFKYTDKSSSQRPRRLGRFAAARLGVKLPPGHGCLSFVIFVCCQV